MATLTDWLNYIRMMHPVAVDYELTRIQKFAEELDLLHPKIPVITVTGTNGKGSVVAGMQAILLEAGYRVGSFTSPYLEKFNEQVQINGEAVYDFMLMDALREIDHRRGIRSFTEFEFTTLAALLLFKRAKLDILLLEVGLGGGEDAVNIMNPDVTVITSIAFDHEEYLGSSLADIASAEAKLLRPGKVAVIGVEGEESVPILKAAEKMNCRILQLGRDFKEYVHLSRLAIFPRNAALAVQALRACPSLSITQAHIIRGLDHIVLKGRQQWIAGKPSFLIDVAHNEEAILALAARLRALPQETGDVVAIFSMLKDKKIAEALITLSPFIKHWCVAPIDHPRAASREQLHAGLIEAHIPRNAFSNYVNLNAACSGAMGLAEPQDVILTCGSFHTARAMLSFLKHKQRWS